MRRGWVSALAVVGIVIWVGVRPAAAQSGGGGGLTPLDARHFALMKGDRIVIYEVDPRHGYALRVVNTALLDGEGQVLGQFRPEKPAVVTPAPAPGKAAPPPASPPPASEPPGPTPLSARRSPAVGPFAPSAWNTLARRSSGRVLGMTGDSLRPQAQSPLAPRPVQPIMQVAAGPAAPRWLKLCKHETLRTGYHDVASAQGTVPGP